MGTYCIAQGTLLNALWWSEWEENPKGKGYMYIHMLDSFCSAVETNKPLLSNYTPIKINLTTKQNN